MRTLDILWYAGLKGSTYTIADMKCPWSSYVNPNLEKIRGLANQWLNKTIKINEEGITKIAKHQLDYQTALFFPYFGLENLLKVAKFLELTSACDSFVDDFRGNVNILSTPKYRDIEQRFYDMLAEAGKTFDLNELQYERFNTYFSGFVETNLEKETMKKYNQILTLEEYPEFRFRNSGIMVFVIAERQLNINLTAYQVNHPAFKKMIKLFALYVCYANDIFSFRAEYFDDHWINIVTVAMVEKSFGLQEAIDFVNDVVLHDTLKSILKTQLEIMEDSLLWTSDMAKCFMMYQVFAAGNITYGLQGSRFHENMGYDRSFPLQVNLQN